MAKEKERHQLDKKELNDLAGGGPPGRPKGLKESKDFGPPGKA